MFVLKLFGGLTLESSDRQVPAGAMQRRRLELLALLAFGRARGLPRDQIQVRLWPDRPDDNARHALEQLIYLIRRDLGRDAVLSDGIVLRLNPLEVTSDLEEFDDAIACGDLARAVRTYTGPILEGVRLHDAPDLEHWFDQKRSEWAQRYAKTLERVALLAEESGAQLEAAEWWRRRAALDPCSAPVTVRLMRALAAAGDRDGAIRQAHVYETLVRNELALEPDPTVLALARAVGTCSRDAPQPDGRVGTSRAAAPPPRHAVLAADSPAVIPQTPPLMASAPIASAPSASAPIASAPLAKQSWRFPATRVLFPITSVAMFVMALASGATRLHREPDAVVLTPAPPPTSVAVLPFTDLGEDRESDYFGDGLTEELIDALSGVPDLRVAARTSVFALKGRALDVRQIGRLLGVRAVLEGSVRRAGDHVRVTVRLVDAATGYERWAESYDRRLVDVLAVQQEIAIAVSNRLSSTAAAAFSSIPNGADTPSYDAFEHYLRGRFYLNQAGAIAVARARRELLEATAADPRYARAHAALAEAYNAMAEGSSGEREQAELIAQAERSARRALDLDSHLAEAHTSLGNLLLNRWDWSGAAGEFQRAIAENRSFAPAYERYGILLSLIGKFDDAIAAMRHAEELDPLSLRIQGSTAYILTLARRYPAAEAVARRVIAVGTEQESARFRLGSVLLQQGRYKEAEHELQIAWHLTASGKNRALPLLGYAYARAGRTADALRLRPFVERGLADHTISPYFTVIYFDAVGHRERAFQVLDDLASRRESCLRDLAVDPLMDPLHRDPRFSRVLRAIGLDSGGPAEVSKRDEVTPAPAGVAVARGHAQLSAHTRHRAGTPPGTTGGRTG